MENTNSSRTFRLMALSVNPVNPRTCSHTENKIKIDKSFNRAGCRYTAFSPCNHTEDTKQFLIHFLHNLRFFLAITRRVKTCS
jgi:hypothetical protein